MYIPDVDICNTTENKITLQYILSPQLLAIYMNNLSAYLTQYQAGFNLNGMNYIGTKFIQIVLPCCVLK